MGKGGFVLESKENRRTRSWIEEKTKERPNSNPKRKKRGAAGLTWVAPLAPPPVVQRRRTEKTARAASRRDPIAVAHARSGRRHKGRSTAALSRTGERAAGEWACGGASIFSGCRWPPPLRGEKIVEEEEDRRARGCRAWPGGGTGHLLRRATVRAAARAAASVSGERKGR